MRSIFARKLVHICRGGYRISGKGVKAREAARKIFGHAHKLINHAPLIAAIARLLAAF